MSLPQTSRGMPQYEAEDSPGSPEAGSSSPSKRKQPPPTEPSEPQQKSSRFESTGIITMDDEKADLEEEIADLKERNKAWERDFDSLEQQMNEYTAHHQFITGNMVGFDNASTHDWPGALGGCLDVAIEGWGLNFVVRRAVDLDPLSESDKEHIIKSLEGYCVQENFDSVIARLSPHIRKVWPGVFAHIFLVKNIVRRIFQSPFWYFTNVPGEGGNQPSFLPCRDQLESLYKTFLDTNELYAQQWRAETVRLANLKWPRDCENTVYGERMAEHRWSLIKQMVAEALSSKTLQLLMKKAREPWEFEIRESTLIKQYENAANLALNISVLSPRLDFKYLADIPSTFDHRLDTTRAHWNHLCDEGDHQLNGRPVLAIVTPLIWARGIQRAFQNFDNVVNRAAVLVESKEQGDYAWVTYLIGPSTVLVDDELGKPESAHEEGSPREESEIEEMVE